MSCKLPNIGIKDTLGLPAERLEVQNVDDMIWGIIDFWNNNTPNFSLSEKQSLTPELYKDRVDLMLEKLGDLMTTVDNKTLDLSKGGSDSQAIIENLRTYYYAKGDITRDEEIDLTAVITGQLLSHEEIAAQRLNKVLDTFFANNLPAKEYFKTHFTRELGLSTVVRIGETLKDSAIVDSQKALNENITAFLSKQYLTVYRYLRSLGFAKGLPNSMFRLNSVAGIDVPIETHINTLDRFYNYVMQLSKIGVLEDEIELGWTNKVTKDDVKSSSLYEAINAYLSIVYFDKLSKEAIGTYISYDKDLRFPITIDEDKKIHYKYKFGKDTENRVHGWQVDVRDALKEMGNFSKFLISSIPIDDTYLTPVNYLGAFTNLFSNISLLYGGTDKVRELWQTIATFNLSPVTKFRDLLTLIHLYDSVRNTLLGDKIVNPYEMKVFDAVYEYVFNGSNSLYNIEASYNKTHGLTNRYPLVESLAALIGSSTGMSYLLTVYDYNKKAYVTEVKKKFQTNKQFYDMIRAINSNNQSIEEVDLAYKVTSSSPSHYVVDLGDTILDINIEMDKNPFGILTKYSQDSGITIKVKSKTTGLDKNVEDLFREIDLSSRAKRQLLIDSRSDKGSAFMEVLEFIDSFTSTGFTTTLDGLLEFELFKQNYPNSPKEALATAIRGLIIKDIHNKFRRAIDNGEYNSSQLLKFIEDSGVYSKSILGVQENGSDWRTLWEPSILGPDLITISYSLNWLNNYIVIKLIMSGEISKANTKNLDRDSIPNYGLAFMGSDIHTLLLDALHKDTGLDSRYLPLTHNLFRNNIGAIKETVIDTDVRTVDGTVKLVKRMTEGELFYHAMVNKFLIPLVMNEKNKYMIIQPTTYSDKTKFVNYKIGTTFDGREITQMSDTELESLYISSIGESYRSILRSVLKDYAQLFDLQDMFNLAYPVVNGADMAPNTEVIQSMVRYIDRRLANMSEYDLTKLRNEKGLKSEILVDTHFRINGNRKFKDANGKKQKGLAFNESLVHYALNVYTKAGIKERLDKEKHRFLNQIIKNKLIFPNIRMTSSGPDSENIWTQAFKYFGESTNGWIRSDGSMVIGKVNGEDVLMGTTIKANDKIELNPVFDKFFMIHSLLSNNLRMVLTGSEINHKNKYLGGIKPNLVITKALNSNNSSNQLAFQDANIVAAVNAVALSKGVDAQQFWNTMSLIEAYEVIDKIIDIPTKNKVKKAIDDKMYEVEAFGQGAQLKRNVIIPATMRYYTQNSLRGIASTMRIAVMDDILAAVFNFTGDSGSVDSHDGAAFINPITSILENWSLQENEVGTVKKPIWHYYDKQHMTSSLVKFAAHTITNNMMQQSQGSRVIMFNMFKKMTKTAWGIEGNILKVAAHKVDGEITLQDLSGGNDIYYQGAEGVHYKIVDFGYDEESKTYYTDEIRVDNKGNGSKSIRKYHYFDADSNHIIYLKPQPQDTTLHTMSSIFEAHQVFGGINSESLIGEGSDRKLRFSEASNYIVANLINNVTVINPEYLKAAEEAKSRGKAAPPKTFDLNTYYQPLKHLMIDYLCNNSAIKNGAGNRNSADRFTNNEDLDTITLGTEYYGILMDADHEADEAEMTEFSLVISSLDAGGRLHNYVRGIYQALGQIALEEASIEMDAIKAYQDNPTDLTRDALYDIIGRTIINNISTARGQAGLAEAIINQIKRKFSLSNAHALDNLKIPFSDANIYSSILSTFASIITNKSIRKKYPGLGAVLSPGYNIMMIYDIDGKQYQYKDIVKIASNAYREYKKRKKEGAKDPEDAYFNALYELDKASLLNGRIISSENWNNLVAEAYLMKKTDEYNSLKWKFKVVDIPGQNPDWDLHTEEFMPTDNVGILILKADKSLEWIDISLDSIEDYYLFKADPRAFIQDKLGGDPVKVLQFRKNIHKSRNLAPTKIWWDYKGKINGENAVRTNNVFNSIHLLRKFAKSDNLSDEQRKRVNSYIERLKALGVKEYSSTQELLDALDSDKEITLHNTPAELIMSNIYLSRFDIGVDESMADIIAKDPKNQKVKKLLQVHSSVTPDFYDFIMTKANNRHTYISLDRHFESTLPTEDGELPDISYRNTYWKDKHRQEVKDGNVLNEVYTTTKDHKLLFRIGRDIVRNDLAYSEEGKYYYDKNTLEKVLGNFNYINGEVVEFIEFVTRHEVTSHGKKHLVYNIDYAKLLNTMSDLDIETSDKKVLTGEEARQYRANSYVQSLIKEMYEADSYELLTINDLQMKRSNLSKVQNILQGLSAIIDGDSAFSYNPELSSYLESISELVSKIPNTKNFKRPDLVYDPETDAIFFTKTKDNGSLGKIIEDRTAAAKKNLSYKRYYSFLRSLYYTASRIPAQTLQSFMNMRLVAYTAEGSNLAYVSHWQTWLLGSDYK